MNIAEIAKLTELSAKTIRFYEEKGLITPPSRALNGYRQYGQTQVNELNLLHQARLVGFSLPQAKELLELYRNPKRRSADVKKQTLAKIEELNRQMEKLNAMKQYLTELADQCPGDDSCCCPIIESLATTNSSVR